MVGLAAVGAALGAMALANRHLAERAEAAHPPEGRFVEAAGVRLHYVEAGRGPPVVLLHGNGSMIQDFASSGLIERAARRHRVIAFDRPGYGHSERPRHTIWTDRAQAALVAAALAELGVRKATVLGHSWGCSVAVALARFHPEAVGALVLASGYFYPSVRADVVAASGPAVPVLGDVLRYTVAPFLARLVWPAATRKIFAPAPVPSRFDGFPKAMAVRPSQIRASAAEAALMIPDAYAASGHYAALDLPVVIIAGEGDRVVDIDDQSGRLHDEVPGSILHRVPDCGHMVHQTAPDAVMAAIDEASALSTRRGRTA
jgi:pimeloyl-ACP methyl ester carboxylesterase